MMRITTTEIITKLIALSSPANVEGMARFGIVTDGRLGVSVPDMRRIAKETGRNHTLALRLWKTGIPEARIMASMIAEPEKLTEKQAESWVKDFNSWDICDQVCMNLFSKTPLAWKKLRDWSSRNEEYVKRAAFVLMACLAVHDKRAEDRRFVRLLPIITQAAADERNFVKKAVNWALRGIGKRNHNLNRMAVKAAREIHRIDSKASRWIAADAIMELTGEAVQMRMRGRLSATGS